VDTLMSGDPTQRRLAREWQVLLERQRDLAFVYLDAVNSGSATRAHLDDLELRLSAVAREIESIRERTARQLPDPGGT
jgi:hypothetical protein